MAPVHKSNSFSQQHHIAITEHPFAFGKKQIVYNLHNLGKHIGCFKCQNILMERWNGKRMRLSFIGYFMCGHGMMTFAKGGLLIYKYY